MLNSSLLGEYCSLRSLILREKKKDARTGRKKRHRMQAGGGILLDPSLWLLRGGARVKQGLAAAGVRTVCSLRWFVDSGERVESVIDYGCSQKRRQCRGMAQGD